MDEEQLRLEAELESVRRELDTYKSPTINHRNSSSRYNHRDVQPSALYHPLEHHHSDSSLDSVHYNTKKRLPLKQRDSVGQNLGMGGENSFYGAQMMHMLLEQQARVYSKENEMLRKEMENLRVSNLLLGIIILMVLIGYDKRCSKEQVSSLFPSTHASTTSSFTSLLSITTSLSS